MASQLAARPGHPAAGFDAILIKATAARHGLHACDAGYRVWHDELLAQSVLAQRLAAAGAHSAIPAAGGTTNP